MLLDREFGSRALEYVVDIVCGGKHVWTAEERLTRLTDTVMEGIEYVVA